MPEPKPPQGFTPLPSADGDSRSKAVEALKSLARTEAEPELAPAPRTLMEQRVDVIIGMMRTGKWVAGQSDTVLAQAWNMGAPSVRRIAAEASRQIRRMLEESEEDKKAILADIRTFMKDIAVQARQQGTPHALRVAADAMDRYADYLGVLPSIKVTTQRDPFGDWTEEELAQFLKDGKRPRRQS